MSTDPTTNAVIPAKCTNCAGPMDSPVFCDHCRSLYPADGLNYFELFGLPAQYDVDVDELRRTYLRISRNVHPDHQCDRGGTLCMRVSASLNEAQRILVDPILRAEYLLEVVGGDSAATDRQVPPEVLSATMMLREEIDEATADGDTAALEDCRQRVAQMHAETAERIMTLARELPGDESTRQTLRSALNSIKYYQRLQNEL